MYKLTLKIFTILGLCLSFSVSANVEAKGTGLGFPRFVSLKGSKANLRTGPGRNFPIEWIYQNKGLPLKVIAEYDKWYKVEDIEGSKGWMHHTLFSGKRMVQIKSNNTVSLQSLPTYGSAPVAWLEPNSIGNVVECPEGKSWCEVSFQKYKGFVERSLLWGVLEGETIKIEE
ncbi:MAG: SH3 domain-containing protein [Alphaproteobacteria bacterium]